jgi:hypothetical protein
MSNTAGGQGLLLSRNVDVEIDGMKTENCRARGGITIQGGWSKVKLRNIDMSDGSWFHMEFDGGAGYDCPELGPMYVEMDFENITSEDSLTFTLAGVAGSNPNSTLRIKNWQHAGLSGHVMFAGVWNSHNVYLVEDSTFHNSGVGNSHFRDPGHGGFLFRNCDFIGKDIGQTFRVSVIPKAIRHMSGSSGENQLITFENCRITAESALFDRGDIPIFALATYAPGQNHHLGNKIKFVNTEFDDKLDGIYHTGGNGSPQLVYENCPMNPSTRDTGTQQRMFHLLGTATSPNRLWHVTLKDCPIGPKPGYFMELARDLGTTHDNHLRMSGIVLPIEQFPTGNQQFGMSGEGYTGHQYLLPDGGENPMLLITSQGIDPPDSNVRGVCNAADPSLAFTRFSNAAGKSYKLIGMPSTWQEEAGP